MIALGMLSSVAKPVIGHAHSLCVISLRIMLVRKNDAKRTDQSSKTPTVKVRGVSKWNVG